MTYNDLPLLELDESPAAVLMPNYEGLDVRFPQKVVFAFLGDTTENYALSHGGRIIAKFNTIYKDHPLFVIDRGGQEIGLCPAPLGAPAAVSVLEWLYAYGAEKVIATGCCGALVELPENVFLVPTRALRDEGTSYHYLPQERFIELDSDAIRRMERTLDSLALSYTECTTWTTDGFFRETRDKVQRRREEGCSVVDMECSAMAACARFRGKEFAQLLFTADSLADTEQYDERGWGKDSFETALSIALEVAAGE